ncbi:MAG: energy transducer TonB [Parachlamydiaceae bacterium]
MMLTYEYVSNKILVAYKDSQRFINKDLLIAFSIALAVHLLFLFLFKIKEFNFFFKYQPLIEFKVESDLAGGVLGIDTSKACLNNKFIEAPCFGENFVAPSLVLTKKTLDPGVLDLRDHMIEPYFESSFEEEIKQPLKIILSHNLAGHEMVNKNLLPSREIKEEGTVIFRVQIDDMSGRVFWFELIHSSGHPHLDKSSIELLNQIEFVTHGQFMTLGEIEFHFHPTEANTHV